MNCVAIPPVEEKQPEPTLTPGNSALVKASPLYCRSLEKERERRTSRGLASCLRGERDEFIDYRQNDGRSEF